MKRRGNWIWVMCLLLLSSACYWRTLRYAFISDDVYPVEKNIFIRDLSNAAYFFRNPYTQGSSPRFSMNVYRPLQTLSFALNYRLGGLDTRVYHATNLTGHILCSALLMILGSMLGLNRGGALFCALLFIVHPAALESVTWIAARSGMMFLAGGLMTIILLLKYQRSRERKFLFASLLPYAFALFSNERAVCILPLFLALDFIRSRKGETILPWNIRAWSYSSLAALTILYLLVRYQEMGGNRQLVEYWGGTFWNNIGNGLKTWPAYLSAFLWPFRLRHTYYTWQTSYRLVESGVILSGVLVLLTLILLAELLSNPRYSTLPSLSLGWMMIFILPFPLLTAIQYSPYQIHHAYGSLAGLCLWAGCLWDWMGRKKGSAATAGKPAMIILSAALAFVTFQDNKAWRDGLTWLKHESELQAENSAARHYIHGLLLRSIDRKDEAAEEFSRALELDPHPNLKAAIYYNYVAVSAHARPGIAGMAAWSALLTRPNDIMPHLECMGSVLSLEGRFREALKWYEEDIAFAPQLSLGYTNISAAYLGLKDPENAEFNARRALDLNPSSAEAYADLGESYLLKKDFRKAEENFMECLRINPDLVYAKEGLDQAGKNLKK